MEEKVTIGSILIVKSPPYYKNQYFYKVTAYGNMIVRANLLNSPKVKKSWSQEEFTLLLEMGIIQITQQSNNKLPK